jgi:predicted ATPase
MILAPQICCRLEGLPLAIELAAARIKMLSQHGLLEGLGSKQTILEGGPETCRPTSAPSTS